VLAVLDFSRLEVKINALFVLLCLVPLATL